LALDANNKIINGEPWLTAASIAIYFKKSKRWAYVTQKKRGMKVKRIKSSKGFGPISLFSKNEFDVYLNNIKKRRKTKRSNNEN